jgi:hypothetical protein
MKAYNAEFKEIELMRCPRCGVYGQVDEICPCAKREPLLLPASSLVEDVKPIEVIPPKPQAMLDLAAERGLGCYGQEAEGVWYYEGGGWFGPELGGEG